MGAGRAGRNGLARGPPEDVGCEGISSADVNGLLVADAEPATGEMDMLLSTLRPEMSCRAYIRRIGCASSKTSACLEMLHCCRGNMPDQQAEQPIPL